MERQEAEGILCDDRQVYEAHCSPHQRANQACMGAGSVSQVSRLRYWPLASSTLILDLYTRNNKYLICVYVYNTCIIYIIYIYQ